MTAEDQPEPAAATIRVDRPLAHERFAGQASRRPGALAAVAGRARVTYRELDESASRLAHRLVDLGAGPEVLIGVHLERGIDAVRALLAIMKAGSGYLPLDPSLPPGRLAVICSRLRPAAVITTSADAFPGTGTRLLPAGELTADAARWPVTSPGIRPRPDSLCYAIGTSGSTGEPKAVAVSYDSLARVLGALVREYGIGDDDRVAQFASLAFDTSIEQMLVALTAGATLVLAPPGILAPSRVLRWAERNRVSVLDLTPAYWRRVLALTEPADARLRAVRLMITGGEMADPAVAGAALRAAPGARLLNAYGLTETAITATLFDVGAGLDAGTAPDRPAASPVPVGRPIAPVTIAVLDERLSPVPAGTVGEIYIGGRAVARGYLGRPALTAQRFLPDPGGEPGGRMYRTGDLGRWRADGNLEVTGRVDRQLKVRGFRVEPGEIESALAGQRDIAAVSVAASPGDSGDTRLVAHYTLRRDAGAAARHQPAAIFRRYLLGRLPGYMIPAEFIARPGSPGEDRAAAAPPSATRDRHERYTPAEQELSVLWARLLGRTDVGLDDDFFALGGDSLLAAEMLAAARALLGLSADAIRPLTHSLLRDPTLRGFAAAAQDARSGRLDADGGDEGRQRVDFAREVRLDAVIRRDGARSRPRPDWSAPADVLLTGATGFLGSHLLSELLAATGARVWCLVRAADEAGAWRRIERAAARYELPVPPRDRVVPLIGDLAEPRLGLSGQTFRDLAGRLDIIYHVGARVNFIYPYQELRAANVTGTREVIRLAGACRGIPVHYVSTTAVLAGLGVAGTREVIEETALAYPERLRVGYVETKYVAEELLRQASAAGLPVAIYRPLDIVASLGTGASSTSTEMYALIRFITDTGLAPAIDLPLDFVPADVCAAAIRRISVSEPGRGRTYHLASPKHALLGSLVDRLRDRGYLVSEIAFADWVRELTRHAARDPAHPMAAFVPLFVNRDPVSGLTVAEMYLEHVFPSYSHANTEHALEGSGIVFPPAGGQLLDRTIDALMERGYLSAPSAGPRPAHGG